VRPSASWGRRVRCSRYNGEPWSVLHFLLARKHLTAVSAWPFSCSTRGTSCDSGKRKSPRRNTTRRYGCPRRGSRTERWAPDRSHKSCTSPSGRSRRPSRGRAYSPRSGSVYGSRNALSSF
jgi:hypothetical protein